MTAGDEITRLATRGVATSSEDGPVVQLQEIACKALEGLTVLAGLLDNLAERMGRLESVQQQTDALDVAAPQTESCNERAKTGEDVKSSQALLEDLSARVCRLERAHSSPDALDVAAQLIRKEISKLTRTVRWPTS
jgi:hypothetical protein